MAAPSMEGAGRSKSNEKPSKVPGQLDLTSPLFDPLEALTSKEVFLPVPDAKPFDNLAKYESFTKVKPKSCQQLNSDNVKGNERNIRDKKTRASDKKLEEDISSQLSKIRVEPKATDIDRSVAEEPGTEKCGRGTQNKSNLCKEERELQASRRKRRMRNVLTRMEEYNKGPLNFLKRCVENRHVVKVWTRSAYEWRGFCTGYIIAFDIHFNLAMMDVDETYRKPKVQDRREEFRKKVSAEVDVSLVRTVDDQLPRPGIPVDIDSEAGNTDEKSSNIDQTSSNTDLVTEVVVDPTLSDAVPAPLTISNNPIFKEESTHKTMKTLIEDTKSETNTNKSASKTSSSKCVVHESNAAESKNPKPSTTSIDSSVRALTRLSIDDTQTSKQSNSPEKNLGDKMKEKTSTRDKQFRSKLCENKASKGKEKIKEKNTEMKKGEKEVKLLQSEKNSSKSNENDTNSSSSSDSSDNESVNKVQISKSEKNILKSKKKVVSLEESTAVKLKHRHVNQLFIRGDNVVSVGILYY